MVGFIVQIIESTPAFCHLIYAYQQFTIFEQAPHLPTLLIVKNLKINNINFTRRRDIAISEYRKVF